MTTYADAINNPDVRNIVFVKMSFRKQFYAWFASGTSGIWYANTSELVESLNEDDISATETASFAALIAQSVATVGAWFYDETASRLYYKPLTSTTAFEHFVVGIIILRLSEFPVENDSSIPHDSRIMALPSVELAAGSTFSANVARIGSGSLGMEVSDAIFSRLDFEPDGDVEIEEALEEQYV